MIVLPNDIELFIGHTHPCDGGRDFLREYPTVRDAFYACDNSSYLMWLALFLDEVERQGITQVMNGALMERGGNSAPADSYMSEIAFFMYIDGFSDAEISETIRQAMIPYIRWGV